MGKKMHVNVFGVHYYALVGINAPDGILTPDDCDFISEAETMNEQGGIDKRYLLIGITSKAAVAIRKLDPITMHGITVNVMKISTIDQSVSVVIGRLIDHAASDNSAIFSISEFPITHNTIMLDKAVEYALECHNEQSTPG